MPEISDLTPVTRIERILDGENLTPVNRLEYFLMKASEGGGGGGTDYQPVQAETTKELVNNWSDPFEGGPIVEGDDYRVIFNGTTYEPLTGTAGENDFICLGNVYMDDSDPEGDYGFGIFYKSGNLYVWSDEGNSCTFQIDKIAQSGGGGTAKTVIKSAMPDIDGEDLYEYIEVVMEIGAGGLLGSTFPAMFVSDSDFSSISENCIPLLLSANSGDIYYPDNYMLIPDEYIIEAVDPLDAVTQHPFFYVKSEIDLGDYRLSLRNPTNASDPIIVMPESDASKIGHYTPS